MFQDAFDESELGVRTKKIVGMVAKKIQAKDPNVDAIQAMELAEKVIEKAGVSTKDGEARALFFMSSKQADNLASLILSNADPDKKEAKAALRANTGVDVALFGRMVADDPQLNTEACCQVAHSISTHQVDNEFDYYTAVDDLRSPEDEKGAGAGMIGTVEYNSSTLYRYATVAVHELFGELASDAAVTVKAIREFIKAFVTSMPTGKQNSFANRTLPDALVVTVRSDQPVNLVGAFEEPVKENGKGFAKASVEKLCSYAQGVYQLYASKPHKEWFVGASLPQPDTSVDLQTLLDEVSQVVTETIEPGGQS
jgi:CRISPR system Cascade subunit CasC